MWDAGGGAAVQASPTAVMEKLATVQMIDVWIPTQDDRWLVLPRYRQPTKELRLVLEKLKLSPKRPRPDYLVIGNTKHFIKHWKGIQIVTGKPTSRNDWEYHLTTK
jgi:hypothetical protein